VRVPVAPRDVYRLLNHGPTTLVTTCRPDGSDANVMAAAWAMPLDFDPPKVAVVVARSPEPASLAALARAAFASSKYAALAAFGARAVVLSSGAPLAVPPGRLEALKDADAAATLDTVVAKGAALDACATTLLARREASLTTLRACGGGAAGAPAPVSR